MVYDGDSKFLRNMMQTHVYIRFSRLCLTMPTSKVHRDILIISRFCRQAPLSPTSTIMSWLAIRSFSGSARPLSLTSSGFLYATFPNLYKTVSLRSLLHYGSPKRTYVPSSNTVRIWGTKVMWCHFLLPSLLKNDLNLRQHVQSREYPKGTRTPRASMWTPVMGPLHNSRREQRIQHRILHNGIRALGNFVAILTGKKYRSQHF